MTNASLASGFIFDLGILPRLIWSIASRQRSAVLPARKSVPKSSTRKPALAELSSWHFQQCCLRKGSTRCSYVVRLSADRNGLTFGASPAWTPPRAHTRRNVSAKNTRAFTGFETSERMTGPETRIPREEVFMTSKPSDGSEFGGKGGHVLWTSIHL